jgi:ATP-dependent Clp endopeptidase proteolytic subunit ClpP
MFDFDKDSATIYIYDEIGPAAWGLIDAEAIAAALATIGSNKHVTVRLNTPGGSVDDGIAIFNMLKRHKGGVTTAVDSLAASMGSYLLQAGSTRIVAENAMVMIHDPWSIAIGNAAELHKTAEVLAKYGERMIPEYAARSGQTPEAVASIMSEETWYVGQEIVEAGFADKMEGESDVKPMVAGLHKLAKSLPACLQKADLYPKLDAIKRHRAIMTPAAAKAMAAEKLKDL